MVDLGLAGKFNGLRFTGTGPLVDNVWISNGPKAYSFGHNTGTADFTYGLSQSDGTYYLTGRSGPDTGTSQPASKIASDYAGYEAYAWVGITSTGSDSVTGHVMSVNGTPVSADLTLDDTTARAG